MFSLPPAPVPIALAAVEADTFTAADARATARALAVGAGGIHPGLQALVPRRFARAPRAVVAAGLVERRASPMDAVGPHFPLGPWPQEASPRLDASSAGKSHSSGSPAGARCMGDPAAEAAAAGNDGWPLLEVWGTLPFWRLRPHAAFGVGVAPPSEAEDEELAGLNKAAASTRESAMVDWQASGRGGTRPEPSDDDWLCEDRDAEAALRRTSAGAVLLGLGLPRWARSLGHRTPAGEGSLTRQPSRVARPHLSP